MSHCLGDGTMAMIDRMPDEVLALVSVLASYIAMTVAMGFLPALQATHPHSKNFTPMSTFPAPNDIIERLQEQVAIMADRIASLQKPKESDEQSEEGDLYKVTIDYTGDTVNEIKIKYFDTVSVASSLCILKSGFLFVASEFGNHHFYQFEKLGDDDDTPEYSSKDFMMTDGERLDTRNLLLVDELASMAPLTDAKRMDLTTSDAVRIYPQGIRHIRANKQVTEWRAPGGRQIVRAATNRQQVVIALTGGELVYFEVDDSGNLSEFHPLPKGRRRVRFLAVGCDDNTVRILSLESSSCLEPLSMQALSGVPESLVMIEIPNQLSEGSLTTLYLNIGLQNGVLLRTVLDQTSGQLSDTRTRFLGERGVKLFELNMAGNPAVLALSSRQWLSYQLQPRILESALQCLEGVVAIAGNELKIFTIEKFGQVFNETAVPLTYTPRRFVVNPVHKSIAIIETDHQTFSPSAKKKKLEKLGFKDEAEEDGLDPTVFGHTRSEPGKWASLVRILNPSTGETTFKLDLEHNEAAFSLAVLNFAVDAGELFLAVGTASDLTLAPKSLASGFIHIYKFVNDGLGPEFVHKTAVEDVPHALLHFQGRLLAGIGRILRIYDLGKRKLLRKCENRSIPTSIVTLHNQGGRIVVGDVQESVHYASYIASDNKIVVFADDKAPRWITCSAMIDYDTVAAGDKFGNFFVDRLPQKISQEIDEDEAGSKSVGKGYLHGAAHKVDLVAHYHVGDVLASLAKASFVAGGREMVLYTSFLGGVGVFIPFQTKEDIDFFQTLEMHMRNEMPPLAGRDHLSYRGYHVPVKGTVDGDICEQYNLLSGDKKRMIAEELDRTPAEIQKKIEDMRIRTV
ncbi:MAG: putative spliceosomal protein sap [Benniella sp.]|nr:MAG: putative spliceosomal protein sap [Benniella sp.]